MFFGIELVADKQTRAPYPASAAVTAKVVSAAFDRGLLVVGGSPGCANGVDGDQLQLSPALVMTEAQIDWAVGVLAEAIEAVREHTCLEGSSAHSSIPLIKFGRCR